VVVLSTLIPVLIVQEPIPGKGGLMIAGEGT